MVPRNSPNSDPGSHYRLSVPPLPHCGSRLQSYCCQKKNHSILYSLLYMDGVIGISTNVYIVRWQMPEEFGAFFPRRLASD